ncbi:MAG: hypothetical protein JWO89_66 [Verrucomicrobiaceae bacterium]|nr:hypothetical protein [Verrucomicrobiaceae bacterium]
MKSLVPVFAFLAVAGLASAETIDLFNGKDLTGWEGKPELWSVKDGCLTGQTQLDPAPEAKGKSLLKSNTFLIWKGEVADFELTLQYKIVDANGKSEGFGNSGIQYRSKIVDPANFVVAGYQGDFETTKKYSGILYEEKGRGILAVRGQKVVIHEGEDAKKPKLEVTGSVGDPDEIQAGIHPADWNEYKIVAKGNHLQHFINGKQTIDVTDETAVGAKSGVLALPIHAGPPMTVQFKDIKLTK